MVERGQGGSIVNVSSAASLRALQDHAIYNASKGAIDSLTMVMALELGPHKVSYFVLLSDKLIEWLTKFIKFYIQPNASRLCFCGFESSSYNHFKMS